LRLPLGDALERELLDGLVEQPVKVELRLQVEENPAEPDRGAIHEHELARHHDRTLLLERLVHSEGLAPAVFRRLDPIGDTAHASLQQRPIDEARPDVEALDQAAAEPLESPGLIGVHDEIVVAAQEAMVEVDHPADELRREDADAAIIEKIDPER